MEKQNEKLWIVSTVLQRKGITGEQTSNVISWRFGDIGEDQAVGSSVKEAMKRKPGFSVSMVTPVEIPNGFIGEIPQTDGERKPIQTKEDHKERHRFLHTCLDELSADYLRSHELVSLQDISVFELITWSSTQVRNPDPLPYKGDSDKEQGGEPK